MEDEVVCTPCWFGYGQGEVHECTDRSTCRCPDLHNQAELARYMTPPTPTGNPAPFVVGRPSGPEGAQ